MARAIVAGHCHRTAWRDGALAVEGPDEDAFTLAVAAAEALLDRPGRTDQPVDSIHVVGSFPPETDGGIPEALGLPSLTVHHHGVGPAAVGAALNTARAATGAAQSSLVLIVDTSGVRGGRDGPVPTGAGAVAFEVADSPGLLPTGAGGRRHPAQRAPDATAWSEAGLRHGGIPDRSARGGLQVVTRAAAPVLLAIWAKTVPGMPVVQSSSEPESLGPARSLPTALGIYALDGRIKDGERGLLAAIPGEETHFIGFERHGPTHWSGRWAETEPTGLPAPTRRGPPEGIAAVSEGAYVPRPRYLDNLPSRWRFAAERCSACGTVTFPARGACRSCRTHEGLVTVLLPRSGVVDAATVVASGAQPTEFDGLVEASGAYGVVLVSIAPGVRVTLQVADHDREPMPIGARVDTVLRRLYPMEGEWRYGRKAIAASAA